MAKARFGKSPRLNSNPYIINNIYHQSTVALTYIYTHFVIGESKLSTNKKKAEKMRNIPTSIRFNAEKNSKELGERNRSSISATENKTSWTNYKRWCINIRYSSAQEENALKWSSFRELRGQRSWPDRGTNHRLHSRPGSMGTEINFHIHFIHKRRIKLGCSTENVPA